MVEEKGNNTARRLKLKKKELHDLALSVASVASVYRCIGVT